MKKLLLIASTLVLLGWQVPLATIAQNDTADTTSERVKVKFDDARKTAIENRCTAVKNRLTALDKSQNNLKDHRDSLVSSILEKLNSFVQRAETAGLDVTELKADVAQLTTLTEQSATSWDSLLSQLGTLLETDCTSDAESFHDSLEDAKDIHAALKDNISAVKDFFSSDIKADLQAIRQQIAN